MKLTRPADRAEFYRLAFPDYPPLRADDRWLDGMWVEEPFPEFPEIPSTPREGVSGVWVLGNNFKGAPYYGAYPPGYLKRIEALFPDRTRTLHAFSGSLARRPLTQSREVTLDLQVLPDKGVVPHVRASVLALPFRPGSFDLVLADPPYGAEEAKRYGVPYAASRQVFRALHGVVEPGGHLVWLDTVMPMFARSQWHWWGVIGIVRSTMHKFRMVTIFQRV